LRLNLVSWDHIKTSPILDRDKIFIRNWEFFISKVTLLNLDHGFWRQWCQQWLQDGLSEMNHAGSSESEQGPQIPVFLEQDYLLASYSNTQAFSTCNRISNAGWWTLASFAVLRETHLSLSHSAICPPHPLSLLTRTKSRKPKIANKAC